MIKIKNIFGLSGRNTFTLCNEDFPERNIIVSCIYIERNKDIKLLNYKIKYSLPEKIRELSLKINLNGNIRPLKFLAKISGSDINIFKEEISNELIAVVFHKSKLIGINQKKQKFNIYQDCLSDEEIKALIKEQIKTNKDSFGMSHQLAQSLAI